jgi:mono/diheme cytochrome c family protein
MPGMFWQVASAIDKKKVRIMKIELSIGLVTLLLAASPPPVYGADAKENYEKHCAKCHGPDGRGQTRMGKQAGAKDYTDAKVQAEMDDARAFKSIKEGQKVNGKEAMKPFGDKLSDEEIKALVAHVRAFKK